MQNLMLNHICYTQLNPVTWCATAYVSWQHNAIKTSLSKPENAVYKRQQQRKGVRLLLQALLNKLAIADSLDESKFPYQLTDHRYYVCFSHTSDGLLESKVAVTISHHRPVGIDIETQNINWIVARRFYDYSEIAILETLPVFQRDPIAKSLWQIKESFIKIHQYKLAQGLGMPYTSIIHNIIEQSSHNNSALLILNDEQTDYQIAMLSAYQTVVVF